MRLTLRQAATRSEANGGRAYVYRTASTQAAVERDLRRAFGARVDFHLGHRDGFICLHAYEDADEPSWGIDFLLVPSFVSVVECAGTYYHTAGNR